ncbi:MAG: lysophospholipid acyltransferase family protein [Novosphingobium sp.]
MAAPRYSLFSRMVRGFLLFLYRMQGWKLEGPGPKSRRCVLIGAPHTTNWDFVFFIGATHEYGLLPGFMGKDALFRWPLGRFMREMGGVPVVRSSSHNYVEQMIEAFQTRDELMLVIAPEGTRKQARRWKSGFYHIAVGANVPIVLGWLDYKTKRGGLGPEMMMTGDYKADLARIRAFYEERNPGHPQLDAITAD